ncbi:PaaX family transcriptional regulator C-terminal domain-containing protein [Streptomyces sp. NPDC004126]|uniref:PaaX family transcriptional regulator C-terminal domain-containing protein n=1 Tax=Streptomyces sp. NPDC004126 TaxID=3390695 RepID=UPI003D003012
MPSRFTQEGRGRKARLHASADPTGSIAPDAEYVRHAYRQDQCLAPWDGTWHLFAFAVPETARQARDALRDTLLRLGAAPLQGGLYVSANPIGDVVEAHARHLEVLPSLSRFSTRDLRVGDEDVPARLAALLWPLRQIADRHEALAALASARLARISGPDRPTDTERLTYTIELAAAFTTAMEPDPLLPPELLPRPWPGTRARILAARCWEALAAGSGEDHGRLRLFRLYEDAVRTLPTRSGGTAGRPGRAASPASGPGLRGPV